MSAQYFARFTPEAWVRDQAIQVDPEGPTEWDCTAFVTPPVLEYLEDLVAMESHVRWGDTGVLDRDDVFKDDPAAPEWIREWRGPFTIRVFRKE